MFKIEITLNGAAIDYPVSYSDRRFAEQECEQVVAELSADFSAVSGKVVIK